MENSNAQYATTVYKLIGSEMPKNTLKVFVVHTINYPNCLYREAATIVEDNLDFFQRIINFS